MSKSRGVVKLARAVADLGEVEYENFREWVKFMKSLPSVGAPLKRKKRAYKKRASSKAVEVAPGVRVVKKGRPRKEEIDHSPRSVEEQG